MLQRLVLWDIDGTLVRTGPLGAAVLERALRSVVGGLPEERVAMSGKTDPQIVAEYLDLLGVDDPEALPAVLERLEHELAAVAAELPATGAALAGAAALLERLGADERVAQSVLTGNLAPNAVVKLAAFGLDRHLDLETGAFGSDHADRRHLVPVALRRQRDLRHRVVPPEHVWVVGDTPNDLACARAAGAACLLVATGRYDLAALAALGAEAVVADLADTDALAALLAGDLAPAS